MSVHSLSRYPKFWLFRVFPQLPYFTPLPTPHTPKVYWTVSGCAIEKSNLEMYSEKLRIPPKMIHTLTDTQIIS